MKTASAKAKGRRLQNKVRDSLRKLLAPFGVHKDNIQSAPMGLSGEDIPLSPAARKYLPISIECKNTEANKVLYKHWDQAVKNARGNNPVVVYQCNRRPTLAAIDYDYWLRLEHNRILMENKE